jgi:hypothetical protein
MARGAGDVAESRPVGSVAVCGIGSVARAVWPDVA